MAAGTCVSWMGSFAKGCTGAALAMIATGAQAVPSDPGTAWQGWERSVAEADVRLDPGPAGAWMGLSVARAGDVNADGYGDVLVGAPEHGGGEGAAFLHLGGPGGVSPSPSVRLLGGQAGCRFGQSVSAAGDVNGDGYDDVVVGAFRWDGPGGVDAGAAFVFLGGPLGIAEGTAANASFRFLGSQADARLGFSVSGAGDVNGDGYDDVVAGAPFFDQSLPDQGAAVVFPGGSETSSSSAQPPPMAVLTYESQGAHLGFAVAGAGDVDGDGYADILAGAPNFGTPSVQSTGIAFLFRGGAGGPRALPSSALRSSQAGAELGHSVAGVGDVNGDGRGDVLVGAHHHNAGTVDEGAAFLYLGNAIGLEEAAPEATFHSNQTGAEMGVGVAGAGDVNGDGFADVLVGAPLYDNPSIPNSGASFLFLGSPQPRSAGPEGAAAVFRADRTGADLGRGVAGAGDVDGDGYADLLLGASASLTPGLQGRAWLFRGGPAAGISVGSGSWRIGSIAATHPPVVARAGDVNGDGYGDMVVGIAGYDNDQQDEGAVFVILGGPSGVATSLAGAQRIESNQAFAGFGFSVSAAGDVNADGYADILVGAPAYSNGQTFEGAAFVFHGGPGGITATDLSGAAGRVEADLAMASLGESVSGAGDVNGDGYDDVIVAVHNYGDKSAFVVLGGTRGIGDNTPATVSTSLPGYITEGRFSFTVAGAGDVNRDGYDDVLVGDPCYGAEYLKNNQGAVFLFLGGPSGTSATAAARIKSGQAGAFLGWSVAGAGDVDGDGYDDVVMGAPELGEGFGQGGVFLFRGGPAGIVGETIADASFQLTGRQPYMQLGAGVATAGDVNGDGYADFATTAIGSDDGRIVYGGPDATALKVSPPLGLRNASGAGDVDGDGYDDVIVADWASRNGDEIHLFRGNAGRPGRNRDLRQRRKNEDLPIQPGGIANEDLRFRIQVRPSHPGGRGRVKLEAEVCRLDLAFDDPGCVRAISEDWAQASSDFIEIPLQALDVGKPFRWRVRELYAPPTGLLSPRRPVHGPWRRAAGRNGNRDLRGGFAQRVMVYFSQGRNEIQEGTPDKAELVLVTQDHHPLRIPARVSYRTVDGTAKANVDYEAASGTIVFDAGALGEKKTIQVTTFGDNTYEPDETFWVELHSPIGTAFGSPLNNVERREVVIRNDDSPPEQTRTVRIPASGYTVDEASFNTYFYVELTTSDKEISDRDVQVSFYTQDGSAKAQGDYGSVSTTVEFPKGTKNGTRAQVWVSFFDDTEAEDDETFTLNLANPAGATLGFYSSIEMKIRDNETVKLVLASATISTSENGSTSDIYVRLSHKPAGDVEVFAESDAPAEGRVTTPMPLKFTTTDWSIYKKITIQGQDDPFIDNPKTYHIDLRSVPATYLPAQVTAVNSDNDSAGVVRCDTEPIVTKGPGTSASFTVRPASRPLAKVVLTPSANNSREATVASGALTFLSRDDWKTDCQTVTVNGKDDNLRDGSVEYVVYFTGSPESDEAYRNRTFWNVTASNEDPETPGLEVKPVGGFETTETGGSASFNLKLASETLENVVITLKPHAEGSVFPSTVTFTPANWSFNQQVTVTGRPDDLDDGDQAYTIELTAASTDAVYKDWNPDDLQLTNLDADVSGFLFSFPDGSSPITSETRTSREIKVSLATRPSHPVKLALATSDASEGTVGAASLTFQPEEWKEGKTVIVTGVDDTLADGSVPYVLLTGPAT
ncbi:MAG: Calx-beta domain-containing protein, partial [Acidobacteriota bacterium]